MDDNSSTELYEGCGDESSLSLIQKEITLHGARHIHVSASSSHLLLVQDGQCLFFLLEYNGLQ
jgi:hypothetical protein